MRISIVTRCDLQFSVDSPAADWSSDYQVARILARRGHVVRFYSWHARPPSRGSIEHVDTAGVDKVRIIDLVCQEDVDVLLVSSWESLLIGIHEAGYTAKKVLHVRANKALLRDAEKIARVNEAADSIIAVSSRLALKLEQLGYEKIELVENGYDPSIFRSNCGVRKNGMVVYAGAMIPEKGVSLLLDAFRIRPESDAQLHLFGSADLHGKAEFYNWDKLCEQDSRIIAHGPVRQRTLARVFQEAEIGVLLTDPSAGFESFGKSALEMQACGLPVIVSDNGALRERVIDGRTGYVLKEYSSRCLADTLHHHAGLSPEQRTQFSREAHAHVKHMTWKRTVTELERVLTVAFRGPKNGAEGSTILEAPLLN